MEVVELRTLLKELAEFDAGSWFGAEFKENLPTLSQVCELIKGTDKIFNVEPRLVPISGVDRKGIGIIGLRPCTHHHYFLLQPLCARIF